MKLIVGLGNPGERYERTRHNVGFMVIDELAKEMGISLKEEKKLGAMVGREGEVILVKPLSFMNESGTVVSKVVNFYKIELQQLVVVHDDLDIRLGEFKFQLGVGTKVHNGVNSVEEKLGSKDFWRARVGVDNRSGEERAQFEGADYVLSKFKSEEMEQVVDVVKKVAGSLNEGLKINS